MKYNYWGEAATAEMNEGDNPRIYLSLEDWWDDDELAAQVNYAQYVEEPINMELR